MRVAVTGAAGFIARAIVRTLAGAGHDVTASDRPGVALPHAGAARAAGVELLDPDATQAMVDGHDAVVHAAGLLDSSAPRDTLFAANVAAVDGVVTACRRAGVRRLVQLSTVGVYGRPRVLPCAETEPSRPRHAYETTKAHGETIARGAMRDLDVTILRPTLVYGPYSRHGFGLFIGALYLMLARGRSSMPGLARGPLMHAVHVTDVARAVTFVLPDARSYGQTYNVADDAAVPSVDVLDMIGAGLGVRVERKLALPPLIHRVAFEAAARYLSERRLGALNHDLARRWRRMAEDIGFEAAFVPRIDRDGLATLSTDHVYDTAKLRRLGFACEHGDVTRGLAETLAWYRAERWLPDPEEVKTWARRPGNARA